MVGEPRVRVVLGLDGESDGRGSVTGGPLEMPVSTLASRIAIQLGHVCIVVCVASDSHAAILSKTEWRETLRDTSCGEVAAAEQASLQQPIL